MFSPLDLKLQKFKWRTRRSKHIFTLELISDIVASYLLCYIAQWCENRLLSSYMVLFITPLAPLSLSLSLSLSMCVCVYIYDHMISLSLSLWISLSIYQSIMMQESCEWSHCKCRRWFCLGIKSEGFLFLFSSVNWAKWWLLQKWFLGFFYS